MSLENGSASASDRTRNCPSWVVFPRVDRDSKYSTRGHGIHGYVRAVLSGVTPELALSAVSGAADQETCRRIDWHKLGGDLADVRTEVAYVLDVRARTARFVGCDIGREYGPLGEWEVPGSLDIEGTRSDGVPVILDVNSGNHDVTDAEDNGQGLFFGAVKYLILGAPEVEFRIGKLKPSGDVYVDRATYTALDIDSYLDDYEDALAASKEARRVYLAGGAPDVREGPHCTYCPAADACPAKTRLARAMLGELRTLDGAVESLTLEQAGSAWEIAHDKIKPLLDRVLGVLKERAKRESLPLPNGDVVREVTYNRESFHTDSALALLRSLGAKDEQILALYESVAVSQVRTTKPPRARRGKAA